jgi:sulfatase maturation enzyme AslB (radical SAM superfamily)
MTGIQWVEAINRIDSRDDLPVSLQGGEPTQHPDFYYIVNNIKRDLNIDLLTNLQFNIDEFMKNVSPDRIKRDAPYASIRVSFHPREMKPAVIVKNILKLLKNGYSIGVWILDHPEFKAENAEMQDLCKKKGIDCRVKEFLGYYKGVLHGTYKYPRALSGKLKSVRCRTSELLISETGDVFKCHSDLYQKENSIGNILNANFECTHIWRPCERYGLCNPCDIKQKTNRLQQKGHCSVEIKNENTDN